jgi:hypothetical protein
VAVAFGGRFLGRSSWTPFASDQSRHDPRGLLTVLLPQ